ncbi:MAG: sulfite exporter TauE/SafE family protein [Bacteroidetes bacterium]|nr:sulfite exporter TauE/SafE family protein [Bacteroidota bacterium]
MNAFLPAAFVLGIAGSAHCIGMCGPIALAVPRTGPGRGARWAAALLLNGGRLATYVLLGAAVGAFGWGLRIAHLQQGVSVAAGVLLLTVLLVPRVFRRWDPTGRIALGIGRSRGILARNLRRTAPEALFLTGALNGLLPCGLVYMALIAAAAAGSVTGGMGFMALFALGTWPALIAVRLGGNLLGPRFRTLLRRASPVMVSFMAVLLILRGLGLGIPFVSPTTPAFPAQATPCHPSTSAMDASGTWDALR